MKTTSTRRLRARAGVMPQHDSEFDDYGPEPNMKLSHAFLVVLLLHVIAVGGLYAFNSMKAGKMPKLTMAKVTAPSGSAGDPSGNGNESDAKPEPPKKSPPAQDKAPLVAKTTEAPKVSEGLAKPHQGLLSSAKAALMRLAGIGAGGSTLASAAAQETTAPAVSSGPAVDAAASAPVAAIKTYLVKSGDTITKISATLGVTILELEKANGMTGNAVLRVGQTLKVPEKNASPTPVDAPGVAPGSIAAAATAAVGASSAGATNTPVATGDMIEYTVVKGDNPYKIAKKFKITPEALMKANGITDPKKIQIGQKLQIPATAKKAPQKAASVQ